MTVWSYCPAQAFSRSYTWLLGLISSREYNKSWDALREERSPAQLLLFAHCKIKEMAERKKTTKTLKSCIVKSVQSNRTCTLDIGDKKTTWKAENNMRQEETSNTPCEILLHGTLVKHINFNHARISPSVL